MFMNTDTHSQTPPTPHPNSPLSPEHNKKDADAGKLDPQSGGADGAGRGCQQEGQLQGLGLGLLGFSLLIAISPAPQGQSLHL